MFRYFAIKDEDGSVRAFQPFFIIDQDLLLGTNTRLGGVIGFIRRLWPRFMKMRTLMVGCAAGEGHLDGAEQLHRASAEILAASITGLAREMNAPLIVLKEFSAQYRDSLQCLLHHGFARVPSMPNTRLNIDYANFDAPLERECVVDSGGLEPPTKRLCASGLQLPGCSGIILESQ